jgi:hypothetical protein
MANFANGDSLPTSKEVLGAVPNGNFIEPVILPPLKLAGGVKLAEYRHDPSCVNEPFPSERLWLKPVEFCVTNRVEFEMPAKLPDPAQASLELAALNWEDVIVTSTWILLSVTGFITALVLNDWESENRIVMTPHTTVTKPSVVTSRLRDLFLSAINSVLRPSSNSSLASTFSLTSLGSESNSCSEFSERFAFNFNFFIRPPETLTKITLKRPVMEGLLHV